eukprot:3543488-Pyramimonas_sp.AAC.1
MAPVPRVELGAAATSSDAALRRRLIEHVRAQQQACQRSDAAAARRQRQDWTKGAATGGGKLAHRFSKPEPLAKATLVTEDEGEGGGPTSQRRRGSAALPQGVASALAGPSAQRRLRGSGQLGGARAAAEAR